MEDYADVPIGLFAHPAAFRFTANIAFIAIEAIKSQTLGEMSMLQVGMWRKTEVKCWQADVLADNT